MPGQSVPEGIEDVTPEWLTAALRPAIGDARVESFDAERIGEEYGFAGRLYRLKVRYDRNAAPTSVVAKLPNPAARWAQDPARRRRLFERNASEVRFYQEIGERAGMRLPRPYYAAIEEDGERYVILMEDLTSGRLASTLGPLPADRIAQVLESTAKMHALWWQEDALPGMAWLPRWGRGGESAQRRLDSSRGPFLEQFGRWIPKVVQRMITDLVSSYGAVLEQLGGPPWTLAHADLHFDNILFDVPGAPVAVVDWQGVSRARGAVDLRFTVADWPDLRERSALLRGYHEALLRGGVTGYSFDDLVEDCRLGLLQHLGGVVLGYANFDADAAIPRERDVTRRFFEEGRLFQALIDHGGEDLLASLANRRAN